MAEFVLKDAVFVLHSASWSNQVRSVTVTYEAETGDKTAMGDNTRENIGGLKTWSMDVEFNQNYSTSLAATLWDLVGTTATVGVKAVDAATSATNPYYNGQAVCTSYTPLGGAVGDVAVARANFVCAGDLTRSEA